MIIVTQEGEKLSEKLSKEGIVSTIIAKVVEGNKPFMIEKGGKRIIDPPKSDELHKALSYERKRKV